VPDVRASSLADFDRYVEEHGIAREHYPAAFELWFAKVTGGPVPRFEKVEREESADGVASRATCRTRRGRARARQFEALASSTTSASGTAQSVPRHIWARRSKSASITPEGWESTGSRSC
jgi:hypothetical protein